MRLIKFLYLFIIGVMLLYLIFPLLDKNSFTNYSNSHPNNVIDINKDIKSTDYWSLGRILIDGTATGVNAHNWSWAVSKPWCTGSGDLNNPYVIENITIDGGDYGDCLKILNSDDYFIVRNCTFYNAYGSGIKLENAENGKLSNNTCRNNGNFGIWLINSLYCEIVNNSIFNNGDKAYNIFPEYIALGGGIALWSSHNNTIQCNYIESNRDFGIALGYTTIYMFGDFGGGWDRYPCYHNIVSNNYLNNSIRYAIWALPRSQNNIISDNRIFGKNILLLEGSLNTKLFRNNLTDSSIRLAGSLEAESSYYIDATNIRNGNPIFYYANVENLNKNNVSKAGQIILVNCRDSLIENMDLNACFDIVLDYCSNITIKKNNLSSLIELFHTDNSIIIENRGELSFGISYSRNNSFLNNNINKTDNLIWIGHSNHTIVSKNCFHGDNIEIWLYKSYFNQLSKNVIVLNKSQSSPSDRMPIQLRESYHNIIIENEILYAEIGIYLYRSDYNSISNNLINQTDIGIFFEISDYNNIKENVLECNNACFYIDPNSIGNNFENNWCNGILSEQLIPGYFSTLVIFWILLLSIIIYFYKENLRKEHNTY